MNTNRDVRISALRAEDPRFSSKTDQVVDEMKTLHLYSCCQSVETKLTLIDW